MATSSSSYYPELSPFGQGGLTMPSLGDWLKSTKFKYTYPTGTDSTATTTSIPDSNPYSAQVQSQLDYAKGYFPIWQQMQEAAAKSAAASTRQQISDLYPSLSAASSEATARNIGVLLTKEQTPTAQALRNQIAQGQIATAAGAEAARDQATAAQALAARQFAKGYAGQTFTSA